MTLLEKKEKVEFYYLGRDSRIFFLFKKKKVCLLVEKEKRQDNPRTGED